MQADEQFNVHDPNEDDRFEEVDSYLFLSLGFSTKQNAWAGPNHWKYRKVKGQIPLAKFIMHLHCYPIV